MSPSRADLCQCLKEAARTEILPHFTQAVTTRKADGSVVTAADYGVQQHIISALEHAYPAIAVLGEEMPLTEQQRLLDSSGEAVFCLDPLDGTSNFAGGFPVFAISLALCRAGRAELGVVYDPIRDECFTAEAGQGAWLNDAPLHCPAPQTRLGECLGLVDLKRLGAAYVQKMGREAPYRSQRNLGSVALDWCWLAAGRGQLYLHGGQKLWDYLAGRLIAAEAGASTQLLTREGEAPPAGLSLEPRLAVAAGNADLFRLWLEWLELPDLLS